MKKIVYLLLLTVSAFVAGCDDDDDNIPVMYPEKTGTVTDTDGNVYKWVRFGGLDWLATNFRGGEPYYDVEDEEYWDVPDTPASAEEDYEIYGNLYSYDEALENVNMLDGEGWRLPSDEDWRKLEEALGMSAVEASGRDWRGAPVGTLLQQDSTGTNLNFLMGGWVAVTRISLVCYELERMREHGYYWTATTVESNYDAGRVAWCRTLRYNSPEICRVQIAVDDVLYSDAGTCPKKMSVRYVRDARD